MKLGLAMVGLKGRGPDDIEDLCCVKGGYPDIHCY